MAHRQSNTKNNRRKKAIDKIVIDSCDRPYQDWFPNARSHKRSFVLHVGPTNSGKTHDALEALKTSGSGCYLAPLRLLALEIGEELRDADVKCDILTGEDQDYQHDATHSSSTIELMDASRHYDVAVIDEAQLIADRNRGGAWLTAIMGVDADVIHVCMAPEAQSIVERLIELCGDDRTVVNHERKTPLIVDNGFVNIHDEDYKPMKGDAIIAFSRRKVLEIAAMLEMNGTRTSVVYGALPWRVRKEEARRFREGETDIVVSTDAIGMGLNLPIRRIIFSESRKFNGTDVVPLRSSEVKQIAGRAGRYGIYDEGHVVGTDYGSTRFIRNNIKASFHVIGKAMVDIPRELMENEKYDLSEIIHGWKRTGISSLFPGSDGMFAKADSSQLMLATDKLEQMESVWNIAFTRDEMIRLISVQFDIGKDEQEYEWRRLCEDYAHHHERMTAWKPTAPTGSQSLSELEKLSRTNGIRFSFMRCLGLMSGTMNHEFMEVRGEIDKLMIRKLLDKNMGDFISTRYYRNDYYDDCYDGFGYVGRDGYRG